MKYFNPSYWFKLWLLSAPLFNDKTQGINAKSIDNKKIKDWANNNTSLKSIENHELNLSNNKTIQLQNDENIQTIKKLETDHFYENFLKTQGWNRDPQIAQQQLQTIQEEHHQFLKAQHEKIRNKRDFLGIGGALESAGKWVGNAAVDTVNAVGTAGKATGNWVAGAAKDTGNFIVNDINWGHVNAGLHTGSMDAFEQSEGGEALVNSIKKKCIDDKGVLVDMIVYGAAGAGGGALVGGPVGGAVLGASAPCASAIIKDQFNINDRRKRNIELNETKWTDDFTKPINHEQNLPIINNTNFVTNNITNL